MELPGLRLELSIVCQFSGGLVAVPGGGGGGEGEVVKYSSDLQETSVDYNYVACWLYVRTCQCKSCRHVNDSNESPSDNAVSEF